MNYYIADAHFCHVNILKYDSRPWDDVDSMESDMIALWNGKVTDSDDIYILGDFCWGSSENWRRILPQLKGKKHLIKGNHDLRKFPEDILGFFEEEPVPCMEIKDGEHNVIMCHYPMISYRHDSKPDTVMLYGHVHTTPEFYAVAESVKKMRECCVASGFDYQGQLYNCWCGFFGWAPASLDEILNNRYAKGETD